MTPLIEFFMRPTGSPYYGWNGIQSQKFFLISFAVIFLLRTIVSSSKDVPSLRYFCLWSPPYFLKHEHPVYFYVVVSLQKSCHSTMTLYFLSSIRQKEQIPKDDLYGLVRIWGFRGTYYYVVYWVNEQMQCVTPTGVRKNCTFSFWQSQFCGQMFYVRDRALSSIQVYASVT